MNENLKLLTQALRSGEYKQTAGVLSINGAYCCLGVACELYMKQADDVVKENRAGEDCFRYDTEAHCLPVKVANWLNIGSTEGRILLTTEVVALLKAANYNVPVDSGSYTYLTVLNDNGLPFSVIADIIDSGAVFELTKESVIQPS